MFASTSLGAHLARGGVGFGLIALGLLSGNIAVLLVAFAAGMVALRGCPMCWTIGLFETAVNAVRARRGEASVQMCTTCGPDTRSA